MLMEICSDDEFRTQQFYDNGQIMYREHYCKGTIERFELWYSNGQMKECAVYDKNETKFQMWYENGNLKRQEHYQDGKLKGKSKEWYNDGQLCIEKWYVNNEVEEFKMWNENGSPFFHQKKSKGKSNGESRTYFSTKILSHIYCIDDEIIDKNFSWEKKSNILLIRRKFHIHCVTSVTGNCIIPDLAQML